jgi:hypothetical protein
MNRGYGSVKHAAACGITAIWEEELSASFNITVRLS